MCTALHSFARLAAGSRAAGRAHKAAWVRCYDAAAGGVFVEAGGARADCGRTANTAVVVAVAGARMLWPAC